MEEFPANIAIALAVGLVSAYVTARLSLRKFHSQKLWETTYESYSRIIQSLHHMKRYCDEHMDSIMLMNYNISEERQNELNTSYRKARDEVAKAVDIGSFVIKDKAVAELQTLISSLCKAREQESYFEYLDTQLAAIKACLENVKTIAKKDLKISRRSI